MTTNNHATTAKTTTSNLSAATPAKYGPTSLEVDEYRIDLVGTLIKAGVWQAITAEERSRVHYTARPAFVVDRNTRSLVGIRVGSTVLKV